MASSSTISPCAACKFLRRRCTPECVFAPDQPQKIVNVHKVFGASNVAKLLNELPPDQREDTVNSLTDEADMLLQGPVEVGGVVEQVMKLREDPAAGTLRQMLTGSGGVPPLLKIAARAIEVVCAKVVMEKAFEVFDQTTCADPLTKDYEKASAAIGVYSVMAGIILLEKKPGLAKFLIKLGAVAISISALLPYGVVLDPVAAWLFGLLALAIIAVPAVYY